MFVSNGYKDRRDAREAEADPQRPELDPGKAGRGSRRHASECGSMGDRRPRDLGADGSADPEPQEGGEAKEEAEALNWARPCRWDRRGSGRASPVTGRFLPVGQVVLQIPVEVLVDADIEHFDHVGLGVEVVREEVLAVLGLEFHNPDASESAELAD